GCSRALASPWAEPAVPPAGPRATPQEACERRVEVDGPVRDHLHRYAAGGLGYMRPCAGDGSRAAAGSSSLDPVERAPIRGLSRSLPTTHGRRRRRARRFRATARATARTRATRPGSALAA